jgi:cytochrome c-type biogenesis protein CcmH/NrfF
MEQQTTAPRPDLAAKVMGIDVNRLLSTTAEQADLVKSISQDVVCMCGTCPKHPISDGCCGWSAGSKQTIQIAVAMGKTREEIIAAYRQAYGDQVLAMVPNEGFAKMAWLFPYLACAVGLALVFAVGMRYAKRGERERAMSAAALKGAGATGSEASRAELAKELEDLD